MMRRRAAANCEVCFCPSAQCAWNMRWIGARRLAVNASKPYTENVSARMAFGHSAENASAYWPKARSGAQSKKCVGAYGLGHSAENASAYWPKAGSGA